MCIVIVPLIAWKPHKDKGSILFKCLEQYLICRRHPVHIVDWMSEQMYVFSAS